MWKKNEAGKKSIWKRLSSPFLLSFPTFSPDIHILQIKIAGMINMRGFRKVTKSSHLVGFLKNNFFCYPGKLQQNSNLKIHYPCKRNNLSTDIDIIWYHLITKSENIIFFKYSLFSTFMLSIFKFVIQKKKSWIIGTICASGRVIHKR